MIPEEEIKQWYAKVINQRAIHRELKVDSNDVRNWRKALKDRERGVSTGHMLYVLNLAGALKLSLPKVGEI